MRNGYIAQQFGNSTLPLQVMQSAAGFYLGTQRGGFPFSRESTEYWRNQSEAEAALAKGEWTQRDHP